MSNQYEAIARLLMNSQQGGKVLKGLGKLGEIAKTEEGKKLAEMLSGPEGDSIKKAAEAVVAGDKETAMELLSALLSTKDGAAVAAKILELLGE